MADRISHQMIKKITAALLTLPLVISIASCSAIDILGSEETHGGRIRSSEPSKPEHGSRGTEPTYETMEPTGSYTSETYVMTDPDFDYISSVYVYSIWYDPTEDNPVYYQVFDTEDMFAMKGVFYFSVPLNATFEARLYKDGEVLLTREVVLKDNVTAEADFSAGMEGWGTFAPGDYYVELLFEGRRVAVTNSIGVV